MTRVLIVERPGAFRDALLHEVSQRGIEAHVRDDAMDALASIERLTPHVVVVSDDPGPPGALGLCRVLQRKLSRAHVYRIGEPSLADQLDDRTVLLPRAVGASAVAAAIFDRANDNGTLVAPRAWEGPVGSLELGPLLIAIEERWLTGRLVITRPGTERELIFLRGQPVFARSTVLSERLGAIAVRRNMLTDAQVEQAVDYARARGIRIGVGMLELGMLDAVGLMRLLCAQLLEQLTAACNAGAGQARFVLDPGVMARYPLQRMANMTALLHSALVMPEGDVVSVLDELASQPISSERRAPVERWLGDLQLEDRDLLAEGGVGSVAALRERLRGVELRDLSGRTISADVVTLALLRSGAFRTRQLINPAHTDLRAGVRTLSPPSLVNAIVRCAQSDYSRWALSGIGRARSPLEQALDVGLHGKRAPALAQLLAAQGPEADCDERFREVYSLLLRDELQVLGSGEAARGGTLAEVRLACHTLLKRIDQIESENLGGLCRVHLLQVRERLERTLAQLPAPELATSRPAPAVPVGYLTPAQVVASQPQPPPPPPAPLPNTVPLPVPALGQAPRTGGWVPEPGGTSQDAAGQTTEPAAVEPLAAQPSAAKLERTQPDSGDMFAKPRGPRGVVSAQERALLEAAEPLLEQGRWRDLRLLLAPDNADAVSLPPVLALLYAVALKEDQSSTKREAHRVPAGAAESIAITVVHQLFDLPEPSMAAVLLAKRLLRRRPLDWKQKPPARVSLMLVVSALLVGALVGVLLLPSLLRLFFK